MTHEDKSSDTNSNVINIATAQRKTRKARNKISMAKDYNEPIEPYEAITVISDALLGIPPTDIAFTFPLSFLSEKGELARHFCFIDGEIAMKELASNEVRELTRTEAGSFAEDVLEQALTYAQEAVGPFYLSAVKNTIKMQQELRYRLLARAQSKKLDFENLPAIAEKSTPGLCRYRLPYDIAALEYDDAMAKAPTWKAYLDRTSDPLAICQFLFEVCTGQGSYKQSLWLHGAPDAGKSTLAIIIKEIFRHPRACVMLNSQTELLHNHTRFLIAKMHGSALVCWDDSSPLLASNAEFKAITGSRLQSLEEKGRKAVPITLSCRHMITSNPPPQYRLDDEKEAKAMATRFVEVEITEAERPTDWDVWKTALKKEFQWLLAAGKRAFLDRYIESKCQSRTDSQVTKSYGQDDMNDFLSDFASCKGMNLQVKNLKSYLIARGYNKDNDVNKLKNILIRYYNTRVVRRDNIRYIENVRML
jgi:hypothetical protein